MVATKCKVVDHNIDHQELPRLISYVNTTLLFVYIPCLGREAQQQAH
jgi:hypothetical protein